MLRVRIGADGVAQFALDDDKSLDKSTPTNETVHALASGFYNLTGQRNAAPYGVRAKSAARHLWHGEAARQPSRAPPRIWRRGLARPPSPGPRRRRSGTPPAGEETLAPGRRRLDESTR